MTGDEKRQNDGEWYVVAKFFFFFRERVDVSLTYSFREFPFATLEHFLGAEFLRRLQSIDQQLSTNSGRARGCQGACQVQQRPVDCTTADL